MRLSHPGAIVAFLCATLASVSPAQLVSPPIRQLGPIVARTKEPLASVLQIRVLSDGRVLVNDTQRKRLLLFDSTLAHFIVVVDTSSGAVRAYGGRGGGGLFAYAGDSSLFADVASLSMLVVDPQGKITRVIAAPRGDAGGLGYATIASYGTAWDGVGDVVSRWPAGRAAEPGVGRGSPPSPLLTSVAAGDRVVVANDSQPIVRIDVLSKQADTAAWLMAAHDKRVMTVFANNSINLRLIRNPFPVSDDWAVLSDGTIAAVRERTYQIDWIAPDGTRTTSPKIPHEWEQITDSAKLAIIDSAKWADSVLDFPVVRRMDSLMKAHTIPSSYMEVMTPNGAQFSITSDGIITPPTYADPTDLPDYRPPFTGTGNVKADADGNIWIRVNLPTPPEGGPVYDVVNRQGKLIDRVQIIRGTTIMGFGPGVVYLTSREGTGVELPARGFDNGGMRLARTRRRTVRSSARQK